jgi:hypothetical protein
LSSSAGRIFSALAYFFISSPYLLISIQSHIENAKNGDGSTTDHFRVSIVYRGGLEIVGLTAGQIIVAVKTD